MQYHVTFPKFGHNSVVFPKWGCSYLPSMGALVHYVSNRDTEDDERPQIEPPPPDLQSIIDKMAMYVAKNGPEFEIVVKSKKDKRFDFLHSWHKHFPYYHHKKTLHLQVGALSPRLVVEVHTDMELTCHVTCCLAPMSVKPSKWMPSTFGSQTFCQLFC